MRETSKHPLRQTGIERERERGRNTYKHTEVDTQTHIRQTEKQANIHIDTPGYREGERQKNTYEHTESDIQTHKERH